MNSALRETWRPFVGKTNGGADRDNGGKIVAMAQNKEGSHVELMGSDRPRFAAHFKRSEIN